MSEDYLNRFALVLIRNNGHLGSFEVDVLDREFAEQLYGEFVRIGCTVEMEVHGARIVVNCPDSVFRETMEHAERLATAQLL